MGLLQNNFGRLTPLLFMGLAMLRAVDVRAASTEEIKSKILETQARIEAWAVEYDGRNLLPEGSLGIYTHRFIAMRYPNDILHTGGKGSARVPWSDDPYQQRITIYGAVQTVERPFGRQFVTSPYKAADGLPGTAGREVILPALGWWAAKDIPSPKWIDRAPSSLSEVARNAEYRSVGTVTLAGYDCDILELAGVDRLYLAPKLGYAIVAREAFELKAKALAIRVTGSGHREVAPGIWAPQTIKRTLFHSDARVPNISPPAVLEESELTITSVRVNNSVEPELFHFRPAAGSLTVDTEGRSQQATAGGEAYLDDLLAWMRKYSTGRPAPASKSVHARIETAAEYSAICLGVCFVAWALRLRIRARSNFKYAGAER